MRAGPAEKGERLQKILAAAGIASRRQCEEYILEGRVTVDGKVVTELGTRFDLNKNDITFDGQAIHREPYFYWWIYKPPGVLSTARDTHGRPTVLDLLPRTKGRLYPVGRLDEESTGLMLLTNDGPLANRLTHPRYGVSKTYEVVVAGRVSGDVMTKLREGIWLAEGKARVSHIERLSVRGESTLLRIVLREGHNREIRRMFARFDHKVMKLQRVAIGPIKLRKLRLGTARRATQEEVEMLRRLAESPVRARAKKPEQASNPAGKASRSKVKAKKP